MYPKFKLLKEMSDLIKDTFGDDLDITKAFNEDSVWQLDEVIERNRELLQTENIKSWASGFGYLLGESIINDIGGEWVFDENHNQWRIDLGNGKGTINPIGKAYKHIMQENESIGSLYTLARYIKEKGFPP